MFEWKTVVPRIEPLLGRPEGPLQSGPGAAFEREMLTGDFERGEIDRDQVLAGLFAEVRSHAESVRLEYGFGAVEHLAAVLEGVSLLYAYSFERNSSREVAKIVAKLNDFGVAIELADPVEWLDQDSEDEEDEDNEE